MTRRTGRCLSIGLDAVSSFRYGRRLRPLNSSAVDASEIMKVAAANGFAAATLIDNDATVAAVDAAIDRAARSLRAGDTFALAYSGHGLAGNTREGFQQSWCLFDRPLPRFGPAGLDAMLARFAPGVRILVVVNCCFAGAEKTVVPLTPRIAAHVVRIAACAADEVAPDASDHTTPSPFVKRFLAALNAHEHGGFAGFFQRLTASSDAVMTPQMEIADPRDETFLRLGPFRLASVD